VETINIVSFSIRSAGRRWAEIRFFWKFQNGGWRLVEPQGEEGRAIGQGCAHTDVQRSMVTVRDLAA